MTWFQTTKFNSLLIPSKHIFAGEITDSQQFGSPYGGGEGSRAGKQTGAGPHRHSWLFLLALGLEDTSFSWIQIHALFSNADLSTPNPLNLLTNPNFQHLFTSSLLMTSDL